MLPQPLHPAVVHFPLVLVFLLPISALVALWAIRRGTTLRRAWAAPVAVAIALSASAWLALETGQSEEDRVESVVSENALSGHEAAAERFLVFSGVAALLAIAGLAGGTVGTAARLLATAGSFALILAAVQVGAAGGDLVYRHGAASAYTQLSGTAPTPGERSRGEEERDEHERR